MKQVFFLFAILSALALGKSSNQVYRMPSSGNTASWGAINLASASAVTGVLAAANGGTGASSFTQYGACYASTSSAIATTAAGTVGYPLVANSGAAPTFQILPVAGGGSGDATLAAHGLLVGEGTSAVAVAATGTSGQVMMSNGASADPSMQTVPGNATILAIPTVQRFTVTSSVNGFIFIVTSANATVGATYTNNSHTFTVLATISGGTTLFTSGISVPTTSGTLTKSGGTGDATITFASEVASGTYTPPSNPAPLYLRIKISGGGGGASGGGTNSATNGSRGDPSYFGVSIAANIMTANGGLGGTWEGVGPSGGGTSLGSAIGFGITGGAGAIGIVGNATAMTGGLGGINPFGGGGAPGSGSGTAATASVANSGAGGSGGGAAAGATEAGGNGGGAGGYLDGILPSATYIYAVGIGGAAGSAGSGGSTSQPGVSGQIVVEEHYQ